MGAVTVPGQLRLERQGRLLGLLRSAGGPCAAAGRVIHVIHTGGPHLCQKDAPESKAPGALQSLSVFRLDDTLRGKEDANPIMQPGDMVSVPDADQVFVIGHVLAPRSITLKDKPITVSRAIAMAGGTARDGETS